LGYGECAGRIRTTRTISYSGSFSEPEVLTEILGGDEGCFFEQIREEKGLAYVVAAVSMEGNAMQPEYGFLAQLSIWHN
jgi:predicted Zn-dependent peptidase